MDIIEERGRYRLVYRGGYYEIEKKEGRKWVLISRHVGYQFGMSTLGLVHSLSGGKLTDLPGGE
jgi:hypothetical protein